MDETGKKQQARGLTVQERAFIRAYSDPSSKTFKDRTASFLEAGYTQVTAVKKGAQILKRLSPHINQSVIVTAGEQHIDINDVELIKSYLQRGLDFNALDCFDSVELPIRDAKGNVVKDPGTGRPYLERRLQVRDLVTAGIDGRLLESIKVTDTQKGQTVEFKSISKLGAMRLMAQMDGAVGNGKNSSGGGTKVTVLQFFGQPMDPAEVNNYDKFRRTLALRLGENPDTWNAPWDDAPVDEPRRINDGE